MEQIRQKIKEQRVLPLFYHDNADTCVSVMRALYDGGIRCLEFTNRGFFAIDNFRRMVAVRNEFMPDLLLATGTVKTAEDATRFAEAGADFLISPVFDPGVAEVAQLYKMLWIPGCTTPTEIHAAQKAGCTVIKLFPGNMLGPGFVEAIAPLFMGLDYVVTGGVEPTMESMNSWFKAGVVAVGLGSKLITKEVLATGNYEQLKTQTRNIIAIARGANQGS